MLNRIFICREVRWPFASRIQALGTREELSKFDVVEMFIKTFVLDLAATAANLFHRSKLKSNTMLKWAVISVAVVRPFLPRRY